MEKPIQLFVPTFRIEECLAEIRECLECGWTGLGYKTVAFEEAWCAYTGLPNAHFLASATAGLHLAVKILKDARGWSEGDEIISTPLTFVSTNHAVGYERLKVVFADVDRYLCLDPEDVERKITPRTRAVIFVGMGGNTGQYERVEALCRDRGIVLILDAAHMAGTRLRGDTPGRNADAVVYSFQAVKNLPTADAGMVCFKDPAHDTLARQLSWLGIDKDTYARSTQGGAYKWRYSVPQLGYKYHGNSIMAAIGLAQLKHLEQDNAYRRQLCRWYDEELAAAAGVAVVPVAEGCESSRHLYQVLIDRRDDIILELNARNIFPGVHYRDNTEYALYRSAGDVVCPAARRASERVISLPLHLRLERADVLRVARTLKDICGAMEGLQNPTLAAET